MEHRTIEQIRALWPNAERELETWMQYKTRKEEEGVKKPNWSKWREEWINFNQPKK